MEKENYTPCPTDKIHTVDYTESAVDQRWFEQFRYTHGFIDALYSQNCITDKTALCIMNSLAELGNCYRDAKHSIRCDYERNRVENHD